jgi:hypothetical protein
MRQHLKFENVFILGTSPANDHWDKIEAQAWDEESTRIEQIPNDPGFRNYVYWNEDEVQNLPPQVVEYYDDIGGLDAKDELIKNLGIDEGLFRAAYNSVKVDIEAERVLKASQDSRLKRYCRETEQSGYTPSSKSEITLYLKHNYRIDEELVPSAICIAMQDLYDEDPPRQGINS